MEHYNRALAAIEDRLEDDIDVGELARMAMTSEHHFRRVFSTLAGMPLSLYIRRRRMTAAAAVVMQGDRTLVQIAAQFGYGSGDSFARAFKQVHGIGPDEARRPGALLRSQARLTFQLTIRGATDMPYRISEKDAFRLVGRCARVPLVFEGDNDAIIAFERRIDAATDERLAGLADLEPAGVLSVCSDFEESRAEGTMLDYHHAVATSRPAAELPTDLDVLEVPAGRWAVFTVTGPLPAALQQLWAVAFQDFFPSNPWQLAPGPEILRVSDVAEDGSSGTGELWLPVEARGGADDARPVVRGRARVSPPLLTAAQRRQFATDGFVVVPGVVGEELLVGADAEVDALLAADPTPDGTVGPHFHFLPPQRLPAADVALRASGALGLANQLVTPHHLDHAHDHIQVALNIPPHPHRPGAPHIDGHRPGEPVSSFTLLAAVFLTDESTPDRGNLWVWPGSHRGHQQLFAERGVKALTEVGGHAIMLDPPVWLGPGVPLLARRGDLLLAHFLLGHNIGGNTSPDTRRILYYRLAAEGHADRWTDTFLDPLTEYPSLRPLAPTEPFAPPPPEGTTRHGTGHQTPSRTWMGSEPQGPPREPRTAEGSNLAPIDRRALRLKPGGAGLVWAHVLDGGGWIPSARATARAATTMDDT